MNLVELFEMFPPEELAKEYREMMSNQKLEYRHGVIVSDYLLYMTNKPVCFDGSDLVDSVTQRNIRCGALTSKFNKDELLEITEDWYAREIISCKKFINYFER
jgi:hypothetical protein